MTIILKTLIVAIIFVYLAVICFLLKKKKLYLKYALLWLMTGIMMILLVLFPELIQWIFDIIGIKVYSNGLFAVLLFFILLILLALTSIVSSANEKNRRLIQTIAILEKRVRELEDRIEE